MSTENFEYDEDVESGDEGFESSDEGFESDEGAESSDEFAMESSDEGGENDESDESFEAAESDEAIDESDESDEAVDEAISASARLQMQQDQNRRNAWSRKVAADQRVEARRAAATQRAITNRINAIPTGVKAPSFSQVGTLRGAGVVTAVLPNGRRSQMRIIPTVAPIGEVNRLRTVIMANERSTAIATGRNSRAIKSLASAQTAAVKRLTSQQVKSDKDISKRLVEGDNRLDKRITKELAGGTGVLGRHSKVMARALRRERKRTLWNNILLASSAPFYAAYGEKGDPFAKNNMILTASLVGWLFSDELLGYVAGKSGALKTGANVLSYVAPFGNAATAYYFLNGKQHERFVAGTNLIPLGQDKIKVQLEGQIGKDALEDFKKETHAVAATTVGGDKVAVQATFSNDGILTLTLPAVAVAATTVAWMIDTRKTLSISPTA